jgi:hypothetical protein
MTLNEFTVKSSYPAVTGLTLAALLISTCFQVDGGTLSCLPHRHNSRSRQGYDTRRPPLSLSHHVAPNVVPAGMRHYPGDLKRTVTYSTVLRKTRICLGVPVNHSPAETYHGGFQVSKALPRAGQAGH